MVSQKKIAEILGVSRSSVAAVLSGHGSRYSQKMQEQIRQLAQEMGYQPDVAAQVVRKGINEKTIAIICDPVGTSNQQVTLALITGLNQLSYNTLVFADDDIEDIFRKIHSNRINKVICNRINEKAQDLCAHYARKYHMRMVMSMLHQRFADFPAFNSDYAGNIRILFRYLHDLGHRNIALMHDGANNAWMSNMFDAFHEECDAKKMPPEKRLSFDFRKRKDILSLLKKQETTAIICIYPGLALWLQEFLLGNGIKVPDDISLVSYGDSIQFLEFMPQIPITALQESPDMDRTQMLVNYLCHPDPALEASAYSRFYKGNLVVRKSSAPPQEKYDYKNMI